MPCLRGKDEETGEHNEKIAKKPHLIPSSWPCNIKKMTRKRKVGACEKVSIVRSQLLFSKGIRCAHILQRCIYAETGGTHVFHSRGVERWLMSAYRRRARMKSERVPATMTDHEQDISYLVCRRYRCAVGDVTVERRRGWCH